MLRVTFSIVLTVEGPFLTKSTLAADYGVDVLVARNQAGQPCIAGTHVAGKLSEAWQEMGLDDRLIETWLGNTRDPTTWEPNTKRLIIDDLVLESVPLPRNLRYRIRLDPVRGSVRKGAYQVIESPFGSGEKLHFRGAVRFITASVNEQNELHEQLLRGLRWIPQLGSNRTVGFGRLFAADIEKTESAKIDTPAIGSPLPAVPKRLALLIRPAAPFCLARRQIVANLYESEETISGGAIKGAIANRLKAVTALSGGDPASSGSGASAWTMLQEQLDKIRITHAFAGQSCLVRPVVPPLSLVKVGGSTLYDVALHKDPVLIKNDGGELEAPAFSIDWKESKDVWDRFGWASLQRELRVRTSIDPGSRRSATNELFAYEMVVPDGHSWFAVLDLSLINDETTRAQVYAALSSLLHHGLDALGKTKAAADVQLLPIGVLGATAHSDPGPRDGRWIIVLQTPALLCEPNTLSEISGEEVLHKAYEAAWSDISKETLKLEWYFARQALAGGNYLHHRFQEGNGHPYQHYLLTEHGSVFVLTVAPNKTPQDGQRIVSKWLQSGLTLPKWAQDRYTRKDQKGDHWTNCPYIRENGYGEIAVNLPVHWDLAPKADKDAVSVVSTEGGDGHED